MEGKIKLLQDSLANSLKLQTQLSNKIDQEILDNFQYRQLSPEEIRCQQLELIIEDKENQIMVAEKSLVDIKNDLQNRAKVQIKDIVENCDDIKRKKGTLETLKKSVKTFTGSKISKTDLDELKLKIEAAEQVIDDQNQNLQNLVQEINQGRHQLKNISTVASSSEIKLSQSLNDYKNEKSQMLENLENYQKTIEDLKIEKKILTESTELANSAVKYSNNRIELIKNSSGAEYLRCQINKLKEGKEKNEAVYNQILLENKSSVENYEILTVKNSMEIELEEQNLLITKLENQIDELSKELDKRESENIKLAKKIDELQKINANLETENSKVIAEKLVELAREEEKIQADLLHWKSACSTATINFNERQQNLEKLIDAEKFLQEKYQILMDELKVRYVEKVRECQLKLKKSKF